MAQRPHQPQDDTHNAVLKNFALDDEDNEQLLDGNNEDNIEFEDDADDNQPETEDDDQHETDDDQQEDTTTEPVVKQPPVDEETKRNDRFAFKEDRQGNFIDKDGRIIVRAGRQRDLFVKIKKAYLKAEQQRDTVFSDYQETVSAAQELLRRYNDLKATKTHFEKVGLSEPEAQQAAEIGALMKLDPKAGVRKILTILHLNGTDLSDIGVTGPVDPKEVARHTLEMQEARKPKEKSAEDIAKEEVQGFLGRHPDARQYSGPLAEAKRRFPHMSYDQIWFQLLLHANKQQEKPQQQRPPANPIPRNSRRDTAPVGERPNGKLSLKAVDPSLSFKDIGRDLLRDIRALEKG